jgi:prepilin signal peptidase PulO-like enzyme (type II secretory pathway)
MYLTICFALLGLIIGSFLNVFVLRRGTSLGGRSRCMSCASELAWYDNVPFLSWFLLHGRCRSCGAAISLQYPIVEALMGFLFALIGASPLPLLLQSIACIITFLLLALALYDLRHTILPDEWVYPLAALSLLFSYLSGYLSSDGAVLFFLSGPLIALPLFLLWFTSKGAWMGLGDAKLALGIGWLLGAYWGFFALTFGFVLGALVSLLILLPLPHYVRLLEQWGIARLKRGGMRFTMKSEVPFGPFLIVSTLCLWFALLFQIPLPL